MSRVHRGAMVVVQIDRDAIAAIEVRVRGDRVDIVRAVCGVRPVHVDAEKPDELGGWIRQVLADAGIKARRAILAAARGEVVLKVLDFPGGGVLDDTERCEVVRLQMARQLTMPITESVIDWVSMEHGEDGLATSVLAGAIHEDRLKWYREVGESAGLRPVGVQLSSGGIAALVRDLEAPVLVVAPTLGGIEFVIASQGRVLFARAVEMSEAWVTIEDADAERIAIEGKRTWMSFRVSQRAEDVDLVAVVGTDSSAQRVRAACAQMTEIESICFGLPERVTVLTNEPIEKNPAVFSLVGLAMRAGDSSDGMDFLNPHKPVDKSAHRRIVALAAVFMLIVLVGVGYLVRSEKLRSLEKTRSNLKENEGQLAKDYLAYLGDLARAEHLTRWDRLDTDYLGHIGWLSERLPDPALSQADRITLATAAQVQYTSQTFPGMFWSSPARLAIGIAGKVQKRTVAIELRDRLLRDGPYVVANRGPDVADRYDFELTTTMLGDPAPSAATVDPQPASDSESTGEAQGGEAAVDDSSAAREGEGP